MDSQEDRLSALPDDLILRILSSLELKQVIATSILSPRWRYLWTSVPNLDLGVWGRFPTLSDLGEWESFPPGKYTLESICLSLARFNSPKIRKFRACFFLHAPKDFEIDMWIRLAVDRSVEEVDLFLNRNFGRNPVPYKVVGCLLDCWSLEVLKLSGCDLNLQASPLCLPLLKLLDLNQVRFSTLDTSGCPLLERLILKECNRDEPLDIYAPNKKLGYLELHDYGGNLEVLTIFALYVCSILCEGYILRDAHNFEVYSSTRTTALKYENPFISHHTGQFLKLLQSVFHAHNFEVYSSPRTTALKYENPFISHHTGQFLKLLQSVFHAHNFEVYSSPRTTALKYENPFISHHTGQFLKLLQSVFHASALELGDNFLESVSFLKAGVELPPSRTTCMKLKINCNESRLAGMSRILSSAPYLEKLILNVHFFSTNFKDPHLDDFDFSLSDLEYSLSTLHSLKIVEVNFPVSGLSLLHNYLFSPNASITVDKFFGEWEKENKLLKSLINSCKVLEKITISTILPLKSELLLDLQNRVLAFPKASSIAEICFSQNPVIV